MFPETFVEKHLAVGEAVREDAQVFTLSDLRQVWAEVNVPAQDLPALKVGAPVHVSATAFDSSAEGVVATVGSLIGAWIGTGSATNVEIMAHLGFDFLIVDLEHGQIVAAVDAAIGERRIDPAEREVQIKLAVRDFAFWKESIALRTPRAELAPRRPETPPTPRKGGGDRRAAQMAAVEAHLKENPNLSYGDALRACAAKNPALFAEAGEGAAPTE